MFHGGTNFGFNGANQADKYDPTIKNGLVLQDVHDRALIFLDDQYIGTVDRWNPQDLSFDIPRQGARLGILVENMGRVNYGPFLKDYKGITEGVRLNEQFLFPAASEKQASETPENSELSKYG